MIRQASHLCAKHLLSVAVTGLIALTACGNEAQMKPDADGSLMLALASQSTDEMLGHMTSEQNRISDSNTCIDIMDTIHAHRDAVAATPEWKTFAATAQWQQVKADGHELGRMNCKHNDPNPSYACAEMVTQIKSDFAAAQQTDAYKACAALPVWKELEKNYDEARENQCLPSQQDATEA